MINIISALLFSISANLDNIAIGLTYGIKKVNIPLYNNILISFITSIFTFLSMYIGTHIAHIIPQKIENIIGSLILITIGIYQIIIQLISKNKIKKSPKNYFSLIIMLSLNNIAVGLAASITGVNIIVATIFTLILSTLFLYTGNLIGRKALNNKFIEKYSELISAILLIITGILQL